MNSQIKSIEGNLTKEINNVTQKQTEQLRKQANEIDDNMRKDGAPTEYTIGMVDKVEKDV